MSAEFDYPEVWLRCQERRELIRLAAVSALERSRGGRDLIPEARSWATFWAAQKPLGRPLSDGSPQFTGGQS